jgi:membrane protein involved in colicin uptake
MANNQKKIREKEERLAEIRKKLEELRKKEEEQKGIAIEASRRAQLAREAREAAEKKLKEGIIELEEARRTWKKRLKPLSAEEIESPILYNRLLKAAIIAALALANIFVWRALIFR